MEETMNFIKTKDEETKKTLEKEGFTLLSYQNGFYTFLNDSMARFSDKEKIIYTNIVSV